MADVQQQLDQGRVPRPYAHSGSVRGQERARGAGQGERNATDAVKADEFSIQLKSDKEEENVQAY